MTAAEIEKVLAARARTFTVTELAAGLQISTFSAQRRRCGRGWDVAEVARLAGMLGITPGEAIS